MTRAGYLQPRDRFSFGTTGFVFAALGAVAGVVAFTATNWFSGNGDSRFTDVKDFLDRLDEAGAANRVAVLYFGWLAWVLLAAAVLLALAATLPSAASSVLRPVGALVALGGIAATLLSLEIVSDDRIGNTTVVPGDAWIDYLKDAAKAPSLYLALGGFLLVAIGAALGPRRR